MVQYYCNGKKGVCEDNYMCNTCDFYDHSGGRYITVSDNPYWDRISDMAKKQRAKGMETYGQGLEMNPADMIQRIEHLQEELIDGLMYCEWIKDKLKEAEV